MQDRDRTKAPMLVTAGLIFNETGHLLLALRPTHKPYGDMWEIPGGKLEPQECHREALCRELKEELDITVGMQDLERVILPLEKQDGRHVYVVRRWQGEPKPLAAQCLTWAPLDNALTLLDVTPLTDIAVHHILQTL